MNKGFHNSCVCFYTKISPLIISTHILPLQTKFGDKTPYSIMFGPDKCGMSSKVHFIIRFKNPVTGEVEEKHSKQADGKMDFFDDKKTHLFALSKYKCFEYALNPYMFCGQL